MNTLPKISVVFPIRNEERYIARTIAIIQAQEYPSECMEMLVVVGDSKDNTMEVVQRLAEADSRIRVLHNPNQWSSSARNIGARAATGEIVTFVDGHTYIDNTRLLFSIAELMKEKDVQVLSRPQFLDTPNQNSFQKAVSAARTSIIGHGINSTIYTDKDKYAHPASSGATYTKNIFAVVGYFDELFDACEDFDFNYRVGEAGYKSFTSMRLAVYYYPRQSMRGLFQQMMRYGTGRMRLARKHPRTVSIGTILPALFVLGLAGLPLLSLLGALPWYVFLFIYGLYSLSIFLFSLKGFMLKHINILFLPGIYFSIHAGLGVGFLAELWQTIRGKGYHAAVAGETAP